MKLQDLIAGIGICVVSTIGWIIALGYPNSYVRWLNIFLLITGIILLFGYINSRKEEETKKLTLKEIKNTLVTKERVNLFITVLFYGLYIFLLIPLLGYKLSTIIFIIGLSLFYGVRKTFVILSVTFGLIIVIHYVFEKIFALPIPTSKLLI